jgi:hypothetical protein
LRRPAGGYENGIVRRCRHCGNGVEDRFRFCPWCAAPQRTKFVEFFAPHPEMPGDRDKALRVSRYLDTEERPAQFRFSIWEHDRAEAVVSLSEEEAGRLAAFVRPPVPRRPLLEQLREVLRS